MSGSGFDVVKDAQNVSCTLKCVNLAAGFQGFPHQRDVQEGCAIVKSSRPFPVVREKYLLPAGRSRVIKV